MFTRNETVLARVLKEKIRRDGPMTFRDFMDHALYAPDMGFYAQGPKIGTLDGTFNTNAMFPAFAFALARAIEQAEDALHCRFRIVECGGGTGELGQRILSFLSQPHDYVVIETSSSLRDQQQARGVKSVASASFLPREPTFLFGNEVLDALPVHRVMGTGQEAILEQYVDLDENGDFFEVYQELSRPLLQERIDREGISVGRGHLAEICLELSPFLSEMASIVSMGYVIFIDYGDEAEKLYHYSRSNGSLRCFHQQARVYDPFNRVGEQDMTSDVDFTAVRLAAEDVGLQFVGRQSQGEWLHSLGIGGLLRAGLSQLPQGEECNLEQLMSPARLGSAFDVLSFKTAGVPHPPGFDSQ